MAFQPSQPPRCLQQFGTRFVEAAEAGLPFDVSFNCYRLVCSCGSDVWRVHGHLIPDEMEFDDPLDVECCRCLQIKGLFDSERDGYDGEIGGSPREYSSGPKHLWRCPQCNSNDGHLIVSLGYQYEPFDSDDPEADRAQDFFDAFLLRHICTDTNTLVEVITIECA